MDSLLTVAYVTVEPQAIFKLHKNKQISISHLVRYYRCYPRRHFYCYGISLLCRRCHVALEFGVILALNCLGRVVTSWHFTNKPGFW